MRTALGPEELMTRCRDRLVQVPDPNDRAGLMAVTDILSGLAFPGKPFNLFGASKMFDKVITTAVLESPALRDMLKDWVFAQARETVRLEVLREGVREALTARFGSVPAACAALDTLDDESRLKALLRLAVTCPDLDTFVAGLTAGA